MVNAGSDSMEGLGPWRLRRPPATEDLLQIRWMADGPAPRLVFRGELDLDGVGVAGLALSEAAAAAGRRPLTLDLRQLEFCDSSGLHLLLMTTRRARTDGRRLAIVPGEAVVRLMRLTGTESEFEIAEG